jgi:magnesium transporter
LISVYVHRDGRTDAVDAVDPSWLRPETALPLWIDLNDPTPDEGRLLADVFHFHELAVEDALAEIHHPKVEAYDSYLYVILHGIDFRAREHRFRTQDVDFFLGPKYLVTVRKHASRSVSRLQDICTRDSRLLGEGAPALMHRIIDAMVDNYRPETDKLQDRLDSLEHDVFSKPKPELVRRILDFKRDVASLRRVVLPQRDVVGRLARREFPQISEQLAYRYRDVHDHLVRLADEATYFQDRVTSLLEAHLSTVSNQLNGVMKVLTVIATIFMPLTVVTGMWGMNVKLPHLPGGDPIQFWWVFLLMLAISLAMLAMFRKNKWI